MQPTNLDNFQQYWKTLLPYLVISKIAVQVGVSLVLLQIHESAKWLNRPKIRVKASAEAFTDEIMLGLLASYLKTAAVDDKVWHDKSDGAYDSEGTDLFSEQRSNQS